MKIRSFTLIGIALAVIVLLAAVTIFASGNTAVNNTKFEVANGKWNISFENVPNLAAVLTQFKGGGLTEVYTTVWNTTITQGSSRTNVAFDPLSSSPSGTYDFRARVTQCDANGNCSVMMWICNSDDSGTHCNQSGWAKVSHTF